MRIKINPKVFRKAARWIEECAVDERHVYTGMPYSCCMAIRVACFSSYNVEMAHIDWFAAIFKPKTRPRGFPQYWWHPSKFAPRLVALHLAAEIAEQELLDAAKKKK